MTTVHHQEYLNTVYTAIGIYHASYVGVSSILTTPADSQQPLSSTEFVEPPPEQNSWVCHCFYCHEDGSGTSLRSTGICVTDYNTWHHIATRNANTDFSRSPGPLRSVLSFLRINS